MGKNSVNSLTEIRPSALLFLRKLRSLQFHVQTSDRREPLVVEVQRVDGEAILYLLSDMRTMPSHLARNFHFLGTLP